MQPHQCPRQSHARPPHVTTPMRQHKNTFIKESGDRKKYGEQLGHGNDPVSTAVESGELRRLKLLCSQQLLCLHLKRDADKRKQGMQKQVEHGNDPATTALLIGRTGDAKQKRKSHNEYIMNLIQAAMFCRCNSTRASALAPLPANPGPPPHHPPASKWIKRSIRHAVIICDEHCCFTQQKECAVTIVGFGELRSAKNAVDVGVPRRWSCAPSSCCLQSEGRTHLTFGEGRTTFDFWWGPLLVGVTFG